MRRNICNIFQANNAPVTGASGGPAYVYPSVPTYADVRCTAQAMGLREVVDEQARVTVFVEWLFMFAEDIQVSPRDMIMFTDQAGVTHQIFVETQRDNAGRNAAYTIRGAEKV